MTPGTWILIALAAALLAMAVSGLGRGAPGVRAFFADLRAWRRREDQTALEEVQPEAVEEVRPAVVEEVEEGGVDDIFDIGEQPATAYIEPTAEPLIRVAQRAVGSLSGLSRR